MSYANAWRCEDCPEANGKQGCPAWTELVESNVQTGEERLTKDCLFQLFPRLFIEVIKASNRPAAAVESCRNEIAQGFTILTEALRFHRKRGKLAQGPHRQESIQVLED